MAQAGKYIFKIFVNGISPGPSVTALNNLLALCRRHLPPGYEIQPIDVNVHPRLVEQYQVVSVPTVVRESPAPVLRATGDLSDTNQALAALGIPTSPPAGAAQPEAPDAGLP